MHNEGHGDPCVGPDYTETSPWRAPGTAPLASPCGNHGGVDGVTLPPTERTIWQAGTAVEVAEAITANHGGGYAYRLCPADREATEQCFQEHHLDFADDVSTVHFVNGSTLDIAATRTNSTPGGRVWTRSPVPNDERCFPAPFPGGVGAHWPFSIVDRVLLPAELAPGDYVLSWRWDCEATPQVWANCADVTVTGSEVPAATPPAATVV